MTKPAPRDPVCPTCKNRITKSNLVMHHNCKEKCFREFIGECIGEASVCWDKDGVFESSRASEIVDRIFDAFHLEAGMNVTRWVDLKRDHDRLAEENKILREAIENMQGILSPNRKGHHAMGCETRAIDVGFTALARVEGLE